MPETRQKGQQDTTLRFFSRVLSANALRTQQHANHSALASDGFMLNTTTLLLKARVCVPHPVVLSAQLCAPFTEGPKRSFERLQPAYHLSSHALVDWTQVSMSMTQKHHL